MKKLLPLLFVSMLPMQAALAHGTQTKGVKVTQVYEQKVPNLPGKSMKGVLVEYEPGGANAAHYHAKSAMIYATVLEGAVQNQINGGPVRTYTKGQSFTEMPGDRHDVSANASKTESAKLLAVFGPRLGRPHVDTVNDSSFANMKELRFDADNGVWRVAFAFDPGRKAVLLVAGDKSGVGEKRFYKNLIAKADRRYQTHLDGFAPSNKEKK